jgi:hypothetical protein
MGPRGFAMKVVDHNDLVPLRNGQSIQFLLRNLLRKQLRIVMDIPNHLVASILLLTFSVLANLEHPDLVRSIRSEFDALGELVAEVNDIARPRQQERVCRLLLVADPRPDDLE